MRHSGDVSAKAKDAEHHHKNSRRQANLGGAADTLSLDGRGDEGNRSTGRPADQDGVAAQERRDRRGQDRREQAKLRRQAHQLRHCQAVGERDQRGDGPPRSVPRKAAPAVTVTPSSPD